MNAFILRQYFYDSKLLKIISSVSNPVLDYNIGVCEFSFDELQLTSPTIIGELPKAVITSSPLHTIPLIILKQVTDYMSYE